MKTIPLRQLVRVTCALLLKSKVFLTCDERQLALARAEGLQVRGLVAAG